ncbi:MAG: hypothetical protein U9R02_09705, partial [Thermodesulfobacteriota bacterium]|nr:hypothetical protein [Thermodesulfobacteriota bacterium]
YLTEKWQRHPAADSRGWKPLLQFTVFSSNKSVNYFYLKMKDVSYLLIFLSFVTISKLFRLVWAINSLSIGYDNQEAGWNQSSQIYTGRL